MIDKKNRKNNTMIEYADVRHIKEAMRSRSAYLKRQIVNIQKRVLLAKLDKMGNDLLELKKEKLRKRLARL